MEVKMSINFRVEGRRRYLPFLKKGEISVMNATMKWTPIFGTDNIMKNYASELGWHILLKSLLRKSFLICFMFPLIFRTLIQWRFSGQTIQNMLLIL